MFATIAGIIENQPASELTLDAITTMLIDVEALVVLRNDQDGTNLNITGTHSQVLATTTRHHGKRQGVSSHRGRKPYKSQGDSRPQCLYCKREGHKEVHYRLKQDAE